MGQVGSRIQEERRETGIWRKETGGVGGGGRGWGEWTQGGKSSSEREQQSPKGTRQAGVLCVSGENGFGRVGGRYENDVEGKKESFCLISSCPSPPLSICSSFYSSFSSFFSLLSLFIALATYCVPNFVIEACKILLFTCSVDQGVFVASAFGSPVSKQLVSKASDTSEYNW